MVLIHSEKSEREIFKGGALFLSTPSYAAEQELFRSLSYIRGVEKREEGGRNEWRDGENLRYSIFIIAH